jgi:hypothetical protein
MQVLDGAAKKAGAKLAPEDVPKEEDENGGQAPPVFVW